MAGIHLLARIHGSAERVYEAIASVEGIAGWFTEATCAAFRPGEILTLNFPDGAKTFDIAECEAPTRITWHCTTRTHEWCDTDIRFAVAQNGDRVIVRFDHDGWPDVTDLFRDCAMSWAYFLESLKLYIETGAGTPESLAPPCEAE